MTHFYANEAQKRHRRSHRQRHVTIDDGTLPLATCMDLLTQPQTCQRVKST
uniref:Uncharacterized protein n=1 Tax=Anguilla anguilla TaxID=7936 RepID=A0A0E9SIF8_ANGAN